MPGVQRIRVFDQLFVLKVLGQLAQLVRASPLHGEGQRFESSIAQISFKLLIVIWTREDSKGAQRALMI